MKKKNHCILCSFLSVCGGDLDFVIFVHTQTKENELDLLICIIIIMVHNT